MGNDRLRQLRESHGWTQEELAEMTADRVERASGHRPGLNAAMISNYENGRGGFPRKHTRAAFRAIFGVTSDADLGFYRGAAQSASMELGSIGPATSDIVASIIELGRSDVERRRFLTSSASVLGALAISDLDSVLRPTQAAAAGRTVRVGKGEVLAVRNMTQVLGDAAAELGGGHARRLAVGYLVEDVAPWLNGTYTQETGRDLFAATSQLAHLIGWMTVDEGNQELARNYYLNSYRLAAEADDAELAATALRGMAAQAIVLRQYSDALNLAQQSLHYGRNLEEPRAVAYYQTTVADAAALNGDQRLALSSIGEAERVIENAPAKTGESWASHFTPGRWAYATGMVFGKLGDADTAAKYLHHALDMYGIDRQRSRASVLAHLGQIQAQQGNYDAAVDSWRKALDCAAGVKSAKVSDAFQDMSKILAAIPQTPEVAALRQRATAIV